MSTKTSVEDGENANEMDMGPLPEAFQSVMDDADLEDFDLNPIINYSHEKGFLMLSCELKSGEILPVPFEQLKKDYLYETVRHAKDMVIGVLVEIVIRNGHWNF